MALWTIPVEQDGQVIQIPVVNLGASPLPSKVRAYKAGVGYGELPLVYPDDNRASKVMVRQGGTTYAIAKDERTSIVHPASVSASATALFHYKNAANEIHLGTTYFNRVTRVEASVSLNAIFRCYDWDSVSADHSGIVKAWIDARRAGAAASSSYIDPGTVRALHPGFSSVWDSGWLGPWSATLAVNLQPGQYDVYLVVRASAGSDWHPSTSLEAVASCSSWTEIARG